MHVDGMFPSKYLKASDLMGRTINVVMDRVDYEEVGQKRERRPILYFRGKEKGMVINKTNARKIAAIYGGDTDDWIGHEIAIYSAMVEFQGETVPAIRVQAPVKPRKAAPNEGKPGLTENPADGMDDEIPF